MKPSERWEAVAALDITGSAKSVLMILALRANSETGKSFISRERLAYEAGVSIRTVTKALHTLELLTLVKVSRDPRRVNNFTLNLLLLGSAKSARGWCEIRTHNRVTTAARKTALSKHPLCIRCHKQQPLGDGQKKCLKCWRLDNPPGTLSTPSA